MKVYVLQKRDGLAWYPCGVVDSEEKAIEWCENTMAIGYRKYSIFIMNGEIK